MSAQWLAALACLVVLLVGCGRQETLELHEWRLQSIDGVKAPDVAVPIPGHVDALLPAGRCTFVLVTHAKLPDDFRGKALTLAIPSLEAPVALRVDGLTMQPLEGSVVPGYPSLSAHGFRIDAARIQSATISIELVVERRSTRGAWMDTTPRLSATPYGDRTFLVVRSLNGTVMVAAFAVVSTIGFTYLALFLFDRRRKVHLWFALQAMGASYYLTEQLGIPQSLLGLHHLSGWFVVLSGVANVYFTHAYFGLGKPSNAFRGLLLLALVVMLAFHGPFEGTIPVLVCVPIALYNLACQVRTLLRIYRKGRERFSAGMMLGGWALTGVTAATDGWYFVGFGEILSGAHTLVIGIGTYSVIQAIVLGRDHAGSLRESDQLNVELEARVKLLEARDQENSLLNDELRRQIADRSRRLAEALSRIGAVPEHVVSLSSGDVVHERYRAVRRLGEGGMGAVYEVERVTDGRRLALKVLTSATSGVALARLAREAQIAAEVSHENLVAIVDVDVSEAGALYLVMELVDGAPLYDARDRYGDVSWARGILRQIALGLAALHARGVVHRDLKPGNVLLTRDGVAKIADFGISRLDDASATPDPLAPTIADPSPIAAPSPIADTTPAARSDLTATGVLMGTPLYMAPELGRGARSAAASSDVWSFGAIAYELTTGLQPFLNPAVLDALAGRSIVPPTPRETTGVEDQLSALIMRCLDRDPAARPTAAHIAATLHT